MAKAKAKGKPEAKAPPPPPLWAFHQNLMVFSGTLRRQQVFETGLGQIATQHNGEGVLAAGFTEVIRAAAVPALDPLAEALDGRLGRCMGFACGRTLFGRYSEFVAIAVHKDSEVIAKGRVMRKTSGTWRCFPHSDELPIGRMPPDVQLDARGLAYVALRLRRPTPAGVDRVIVGFMHNMYKVGDRSGAYQNIPKFARLIRAEHKELKGVRFLAGGDWNISPRPPRRRSGVAVVCEGGVKKPVKTTLHHAYDYWLTDLEPADLQPKVWTQTRGKGTGLSDHAGIGVRLG